MQHGRERKKLDATIAVNQVAEVLGIQERSIQVKVEATVNGKAKTVEILVPHDILEPQKDRPVATYHRCALFVRLCSQWACASAQYFPHFKHVRSTHASCST